MRIVAFSDYHNNISVKVPDGDVLVIAGDSSLFGEKDRFVDFVSQLPHKHKIFVAGNHDDFAARGLAEEVIPEMEYLEDSSVTIDGVKFYGAPWHTVIGHPFGITEMEMDQRWQEIPDDTDVLITHMPPYGTLDGGHPDSHWGCIHLADRIYEVQPKICIYGHLHIGHGNEEHMGTRYYNVALTDSKYNIIHEPTVIEL
jgi:Icc-related predicted phosphoesterase